MMRTDSLPSDTNAEAAVLSSILFRPGVLPSVEKILSVRDFVSPWHREVYSVIVAQRLDGKPVDEALILSRLRQNGKIEHPAHFLSELAQREATAVHAEYYAELIAEASRKRRLAEMSNAAHTAAMNVVSSEQVFNDLGSELDEFERSSTRSAIDYNPMSMAELDDGDFGVKYLVDGVIVAGQPGIIGGTFKSLKTTVTVDLAVSLATATPFLGQFHVADQASVGMFSGESGLGTLQETFRRVCEAKNLSLRDASKVVLSIELPRISDSVHLIALERFIADHDLALAIIDPSYLALSDLGDDAPNQFKGGKMLMGVTELCQRTGAAIYLVNHTRRGGGFDVPKLDHLAYPVFAQWARQWVLLGPRQDWDADAGRHWLWLTIGGSAGHASTWGLNVVEGKNSDVGGRAWDVAVTSASDARREILDNDSAEREAAKEEKRRVEVDLGREAIKDALRSIEGHQNTKTGIQTRSGHKGKVFDLALGQMIRAGELIEVKIQRANNQSYDGYKMVWRDQK